MPPPYPRITVPLTPAQIGEALADLSASFPSLCTLETFPNKSVEGRDIHFVKSGVSTYCSSGTTGRGTVASRRKASSPRTKAGR